MPTEDLEQAVPDETLDVQGEICPYPQIYTMRKLESMRPGTVLEVLTDHPPAAEETIPGYCEEMLYAYSVKKEGAVYLIKIRKGGLVNGPSK
jgi:tRNA 2-thiouridine synthesizing protein A